MRKIFRILTALALSLSLSAAYTAASHAGVHAAVHVAKDKGGDNGDGHGHGGDKDDHGNKGGDDEKKECEDQGDENGEDNGDESDNGYKGGKCFEPGDNGDNGNNGGGKHEDLVTVPSSDVQLSFTGSKAVAKTKIVLQKISMNGVPKGAKVFKVFANGPVPKLHLKGNRHLYKYDPATKTWTRVSAVNGPGIYMVKKG
jgi:hypothetical protein